jgi:IQ domain-containing protein H
MKRISMEKFLQRENAQIARLFAVRDPNVDVVYVSPFSLTNDVTGYYMKILEIGEVDNPNSRVNIVVPENIHRFPNHFSLA